jgi:transcriptional regulator with XRE-family HTH domain
MIARELYSLTRRQENECYRVDEESIGLNATAIGGKIKVDRTTVSKWETGRSLPRGATLFALAKLFGCMVDELLVENLNKTLFSYNSFI